MGSTAPRCRAEGVNCGNRTWHPSGLCHLHVNMEMGSRSSAPFPGGDAPRPSSYGYGASPHDPSGVMESARGAFPDMIGEVHPRSMREQVVNTLQSAVSIEAYRQFPKTVDVVDSTRDEMIKVYYSELVQSLVPSPVTISDRDARMVSHSSEDSYGRGLDESRALASYGLRKEWELARSLGFDNDENRVPYSDDFSQYCANNQRYFSRVVSDEFMRQMNHYHDIVSDVMGRRTAGYGQESPMTTSAAASAQGQYTPRTGEGRSEAADALKEISKMVGRWGMNKARNVPGKMREMKQERKQWEEDARRARMAEEDRLIREEMVARARESRRRRTGSIW